MFSLSTLDKIEFIEVHSIDLEDDPAPEENNQFYFSLRIHKTDTIKPIELLFSDEKSRLTSYDKIKKNLESVNVKIISI